MINNWIPVRTGLFENHRLIQIARGSGRPRHEVIGLLVHFWSWVSCQTVDGRIGGLIVEDLVESIGADPGFWRAVEAAGWLEATDNGLVVPRAEWWLGNGAKARFLKNERQNRWRNGRRSRDASVDAPVDAPEARDFDTAQNEPGQNGDARSGDAPVDGGAPTKTPINRGKRGKSDACVDAHVDGRTSTEASPREEKIINTPPTPSREEVRESFDRFWRAYPKKKNKVAARRAWDDLAPDATLVVSILAAVDGQRRSEGWQREDGRFVPMPAKWLQERRWEDEPTAPAQPAEKSIEVKIARQVATREENRQMQENSALRTTRLSRRPQEGGEPCQP